jgi:hypothetical protein
MIVFEPATPTALSLALKHEAKTVFPHIPEMVAFGRVALIPSLLPCAPRRCKLEEPLTPPSPIGALPAVPHPTGKTL